MMSFKKYLSSFIFGNCSKDKSNLMKNKFIGASSLVGGVVLGSVALMMYIKIQSNDALITNIHRAQNVDVKGLFAIVTGANSGTGYKTAKHLLLKGVHVTLACRNETKAKEAVKKLSNVHGIHSKNILYLNLDLSSLKSVKKFVDDYLKLNIPLHILVNNAGNPPSKKLYFTSDGHENLYQVHYLSHFLLTYKLLPLIIKSVKTNKAAQKLVGRIHTVSSTSHVYGELYNEPLCITATRKSRKEFYEKTYKYWSFGKTKSSFGILDEGLKIYGNAKLSQICWMKYLQILFEKYGIDKYVCSSSCHIGMVRTNIWGFDKAKGFDKFSITAFYPVMYLLSRSAQEGTESILHCILGQVKNNKYYVPGGYMSNCTPYPIKYKNNSQYSEDKLKQLWINTCTTLSLDANTNFQD